MSVLTKSINAALVDLQIKDLFRAAMTDMLAIENGVAGLLKASVALDPASIADGAGATSTVTVPGAQLGDFAFASFGLSVQGMTVTAYVSANDTVAVRFQNESGGVIDLAANTLYASVLPQTVNARNLGYLEASATLDVASLLDGAGATSTITVTGAALGDIAIFSMGLDLQGITTTAYVSAANTVSVRFQNESGGTIDLASTTLRVKVIPAALAAAQNALGGCLFGFATYDPPSLIDAAGATTTVTVTGAQLSDMPVVSFSLDLQGILVTAFVSAPDTVSVRFQNETAGTLDLASGTLRVATMRAAQANFFPPVSLIA